MELSLSFSPCPNDTFMFYAIARKKINTSGINFKIHIADVEELNKKANKSIYDVTKISYGAYPYINKKYELLFSGSALGQNCGPILIGKKKIVDLLHKKGDELDNLKIGIPGKNTTAYLLFRIAYPKAKNIKEYIFYEIEDAILNNEIDAGLIIHENRFTYKQKGLKKIIDLGEFWEKNYNCLIPLGAIAIKRNLPIELKKKVNNIIEKSIKYAIKNPSESYNYVKNYAQNKDDRIIKQHIKLYVNKESIRLSPNAIKSIKRLYNIAEKEKIIGKIEKNIFIR